jgi:mannose-6-phosphate isomerase-like protein (cupin superfamily)
MNGYIANIERLAQSNGNFRHVLYTGRNLQLVLMSLAPGEEIGSEVHHDRDQFFRIEMGTAEVVIDGHIHEVSDGSAVLVPAGSRHNVINKGKAALKLYTIYGPPNHVDQLIQKTKAEASASSEKFVGATTE